MHTKHLPINNGSDGQIVEDIGKELPDLGVAVFGLALSVEPINLCDLSGFMVTSDQTDSIWVSQLEQHQKGDCLYTMSSTIYIVT